MAFPVEKDETFDPIDVRLLGAQKVMLEPNRGRGYGPAVLA
jgi:hypothetical protein